jgi:hypothetical protein
LATFRFVAFTGTDQLVSNPDPIGGCLVDVVALSINR